MDRDFSALRQQHFSPLADVGVDVSMATRLARLDAVAKDNQSELRDAHYVSEQGGGVLQDLAWPDHLSPHLQRNKQLHDTLMQKEEELARLQEENNKLKEFLNSSYVKSLEEKSKKLLSAKSGSDVRYRKRSLQEEGDYLNLSRLLQGGEGKRACRNLSLEFCSAEELTTTPPLDSWILETLGLQDEDTIDPDSSFSSPTADHTPSFSSPATNSDHFSPQDSATCSPAAGGQCEYSTFTDSSSSLGLSIGSSVEHSTLDHTPLYTITPTGSLISSLPAIVPVAPFTPPRAASTPHHSHAQSLTQHYYGHAMSSPTGGESVLYSTRRRTDLAFSMMLSPQSSIKTHTFPQGQAFTRRDSQGGWNFTWLPKQSS